MRFETLAIHAGPVADPTYGAVMTPVYQVSTFGFRGVKQPGPFDYSRSGNPTRKVLEQTLAALDGGTAGFAFGTGMAAEATVLALLSAGDHLIVHDDLYGGTYRLVTGIASRQGVARLRPGAVLGTLQQGAEPSVCIGKGIASSSIEMATSAAERRLMYVPTTWMSRSVTSSPRGLPSKPGSRRSSARARGSSACHHLFDCGTFAQRLVNK